MSLERFRFSGKNCMRMNAQKGESLLENDLSTTIGKIVPIQCKTCKQVKTSWDGTSSRLSYGI